MDTSDTLDSSFRKSPIGVNWENSLEEPSLPSQVSTQRPTLPCIRKTQVL